MNKQTTTIYDVAKKAEVSMATVSRVVNDNPNVKPSTRKKVLEVIEQLDYRPNAVARGLASKKTTTVGVIIPDISNAFFASLALGVDDIATMYKYNIGLANSNGDAQKELIVFNTLLAKQMDGIIFMGRRITDKMREGFSRTYIPIVLAGTIDSNKKIPSVNINYKLASKDATSLLASHDNKKIAFISGPLIDPINKQRLKGYKAALLENYLSYSKDLIFETNYNFEEGKKLAKRIKNIEATACYVTDDELAIGLMNGLLDLGVAIPEKIEIITSNNSALTEFARPRISSIKQSLYDLGAVSMRLLTKLMNKEEVEKRNVILPYNIEEKGSTKKI
ncbi:MAG: catabolite control protein A [Streptococcaceae bacterium]|jgi:LacI family transcriptional regulator|nr:catabolite control protein A [Streptococcaceae bacterium]